MEIDEKTRFPGRKIPSLKCTWWWSTDALGGVDLASGRASSLVTYPLFLFLIILLSFCHCSSALFAAAVSAFAPATRNGFTTSLTATKSLADEVDTIGNNIAVKNLLESVESSRLLTKVAQSGLLSKAQKAGLSLSKLEPLLALAATNKDVLILVEAATPEVLPILPKLIELAPPALPLLASAVSISPGLLQIAGLASFAAAAGAVVLIPDDTIVEVAAQTIAVGALGAAGAASLVGSAILSKIFK